jgi:serine/threonine protein kinase
MKPLTPNTMIQNRYLIVQPIGKGGMGDVYLAVDQRLGSAVALKRTFFAEDNALGAAFEREARILARLRHPVLPKVIDHFAENGDQYLVMEHISGDDLSKRLEGQNKPFPLKWVMFWADQLLDALSYLHTHEPPIIHRDIKPQNLKLTDENHIVLLDFGLSKDFDSSMPGDMNSASVAGYSPHFAAMEQIRGTGTDGRSDLFSLSATLYQLLANSIPCEALSRADSLLGGKEDPIVPLSEVNPDVPKEVSDVILKGIALRQNERYATAAEMQRALRRAYNRGEVEATPAEAHSSATNNQSPLASTSPPEITVAPNFDATMKVDEAASSPVRRQADVKTEVMAPANLPRVESSQPVHSKAPAAAAQSTANETSNANGKPASRPPSDSVLTKTSDRSTNGKSRSKAGLLVGGMLGLLVVGALAAGGGWYAYKNYRSGQAPKPQPTIPAQTPEPIRALEPAANIAVPPSVPDANSAADNNLGASNTDIPSAPGSVASKPTSGRARPGTPPGPGKPAGPRPADKAKPKDDRTVILQ